MTLVELWHGVRGAKEKKMLAEMESEIERIAVDRTSGIQPQNWRSAPENRVHVPASDIIIAACATTRGLELNIATNTLTTCCPIAKSLR